MPDTRKGHNPSGAPDPTREQSEIFSKNYQNVASAIDTQRMSISGVDEDEEAMDLIKFQNAYNLSS